MLYSPSTIHLLEYLCETTAGIFLLWGGAYRWAQGDTEIDEAQLIAQKVHELANSGYRFDEIAILARLYRLMPLIEGTLIKEKIPYNSFGEFFYDRQDIKSAVAAIQYLLKGGPDEISDRELLGGIRADLYPHHENLTLRCASHFRVLASSSMNSPPIRIMVYALAISTYLDALEYLVSEHEEVSDLLAHIEEARMINRSPQGGKVNLMTIHQAKGLEFKCVIVPGLNEGILPHVNSVEQLTNLEEDRRLMYVAITRAMEMLIITYRKRQIGQAVTSPSRFLKEIAG